MASWIITRYKLETIRSIAIVILIIGAICTLSEALFIVIVGLCMTCFGFFTAHSLTAASVSRTATHLKGSASSLYLVSYYLGVASGSTLLGPLWGILNWQGFILFITTLLLIYLIFLQFMLSRLFKHSPNLL